MRQIVVKILLITLSTLLVIGSIVLIVFTFTKGTVEGGYVMKDGKLYHKSDIVEVYETTGNKSKMLFRGSDLVFDKSSDANTLITVDSKVKKQQVRAIGAAMTHASAYNINNSKNKDAMLKALFSPTEGAGFNIVRVPIGTSDYGTYVDGVLKHYTLNDIESGEDLELEHFSIKNDLIDLIPTIISAKEANPSLEVLIAPWSAPAWMKDTKRLQSGQLKPEYEEVYAKYLLKTITEYEKAGVKVDYLSLLNEPEMHASSYPVMNMPVDQQIRLVKIVGKMLKDNNLNVKIMGFDHNTDNILYPLALLEDKDANKYISGIAFHGYVGDILDHSYAYQQIHDEFPNKEIYFTEITAGDWNVDFASNLSYSLTNAILGTFNYHGSMVTYWNLVLDENNMPFYGGAGNSHGILTKALNDEWFSKSAEYHGLAHVSKFIDLSNHSVHVIEAESTNEMIMTSAFIRDDGKIVVVVLNNSDLFSETIEISYKGKSISYEIMPQSVTTFVW